MPDLVQVGSLPCCTARWRPVHPHCPPIDPAPQIDGAHPVGCTAVSWSPAAPKGSLVSSKAPGQPVRRLASAGCDNCVKVGRGRAGAWLGMHSV